jgi:hypothetical protein
VAKQALVNDSLEHHARVVLAEIGHVDWMDRTFEAGEGADVDPVATQPSLPARTSVRPMPESRMKRRPTPFNSTGTTTK